VRFDDAHGIVARHLRTRCARRGGLHGLLDVDEAELLVAAVTDPEQDRVAQPPERTAALTQ